MIKTSLMSNFAVYLFIGTVYFGSIHARYAEIKRLVSKDVLSLLVAGTITTALWPFFLGSELGEWVSEKLVKL